MTDPAEYTREIERYLCQRNRGHLVRVVGPAFELVRNWATSGVPLKVALQGIERCCARLEARGQRRRPVRVEFCEADVLEAFDAWRRAVGVTAAAVGEPAAAEEEPAASRKPALAAHVERVIARLAHARGTGIAATRLQRHLEDAIRELEPLAASSVRSRGETRGRLVARLTEMDGELIAAAVGELDAERAARLRGEAVEELAAFGSRMPADAREQAIEAAFQRLVREAAALPTIRYE